MFLICVWVDDIINDNQFEQSVPLLFMGNWLKKNNCTIEFHILFMYGRNKLSKQYMDKLVHFENFKVFEYECYYKESHSKYQMLEMFGRYETNCFLRWGIIRNHLKVIGYNGQVIHIDGDVIFNAQPEEVLKDVKGLTFTLQGCPAFVSISNHKWFDHYQKELDNFCENIEMYSRKAWEERYGYEKTHRNKWAGSRDREIISSDQDLISHLIHTGKLLQDDPVVFTKKFNLYYAENPLYIHSHAELQLGQKDKLVFSVRENRCYIND